jgi:acyl carrier protein
MNGHLSALVEFVNRDLLEGKGAGVDADSALFEDGKLDSLNILRLIAFIETRRGRSIPDREIVMSRFKNLRTIAESCLS